MMQTDVLSAHTNITALMVDHTARLKGMVVSGSATTGYVYIWDSLTIPVAATYGRDAAGLITVTQVAHGLVTGDKVGLVLGAGGGGQGTTDNYVVTRLTADTYTVQDINLGTISPPQPALQGDRWLTSIDMRANDSTTMSLPGEGMLARTGIFATVSGLTGMTIFYG